MTPRSTWLAFFTVSAVILSAGGFLGATVWRQDAREQRAGAEALWEQKVQAALWRMDAAASAMVAREAARRPEEIVALARENRPATRMGPPTTPSAPAVAEVTAHAGKSRSGEAPAARRATSEALQKNKSRYFSEKVTLPPRSAASTLSDGKAEETAKNTGTRSAPPTDRLRAKREEPTPTHADADLARQLPAPAAAPAVAPPNDQAYGYATGGNRAEAQVEAQVLNSFVQRKAAQQAISSNLRADSLHGAGGREASTKEVAAVGALTAVAEAKDLVLARRVETRGGEIVQGVRLDIAAVTRELLALVRADFPKAQLVPEYASPPPNLARTLAALPLRFEPHDAPVVTTVWTPTRSAVASAGGALLVALAAVALLLARTLALSERRASFVSTMTHELRTPLTTFRLYTDLLEAAPEIADRTRYTRVLAREAERLSHLVENVLSYARLERGRAKPAPKPQKTEDLLAPALDRLRERAERAGFALELAPHDGTHKVKADTAIVEQILLNLVDNAGKYAVGAQDKRLVLSADERGLALRDFGPGLDPVMQKRLFTPFSRSDKEAAGHAPGVGLGLALCRRLAREMGGDLTYRKMDPGAEFTLRLPA